MKLLFFLLIPCSYLFSQDYYDLEKVYYPAPVVYPIEIESTPYPVNFNLYPYTREQRYWQISIDQMIIRNKELFNYRDRLSKEEDN